MYALRPDILNNLITFFFSMSYRCLQKFYFKSYILRFFNLRYFRLNIFWHGNPKYVWMASYEWRMQLHSISITSTKITTNGLCVFYIFLSFIPCANRNKNKLITKSYKIIPVDGWSEVRTILFLFRSSFVLCAKTTNRSIDRSNKKVGTILLLLLSFMF